LSRNLLQFDENSKSLIHHFKYSDKTHSAEIFARLSLARYGSELFDIDFIVPVPMNRFKRIFRRYNPPQIFGLELAKLTGVKIIPDLLIKTKWTKPQTQLSKNQREKNLCNSLKYNSSYDCSHKNILLVDDVRTTGSTANNCAKILKNYGANIVKLLTIGAT
jgi:ComF family protein